MTFTLTPLPSQGLKMLCPWCAASILIATETKIAAPDGGNVLDDVGMIYRLCHRLSEQQRTPHTFECYAGHGKCAACQRCYAIFGAQFINALQQCPTTDDYLHGTYSFLGLPRLQLARYRFRGLPRLPFRTHGVTSANLQCAAPTWIVATADTPVGQLHEHWFGAFRADGGNQATCPSQSPPLRGIDFQVGVELLLPLWDALRAFNRG